MDPVRTVVTVLAMVAAAKLKHAIGQDIEDAYGRIKALIHVRYTKVDLEPLEKEPESEGIRALLETELTVAGAGQDQDLLKETITLVDSLEKTMKPIVVGVRLEEF